jgi:HEAT repeats
LSANFRNTTLAPCEKTFVRISALNALFQAAYDKGVADWLPLLLDDQPEVVQTAELKLESLEYCHWEEWPSSDVFITASEYHDPGDLAILGVINALGNENDRWRNRVVGVVENWSGCPKALEGALVSETKEQVLSLIIYLLGEISDPNSRIALEAFIEHGPSSHRAEADRALNGLPPPLVFYEEPGKALARVNNVKQLIAHLKDRLLCQEAEDRLVRIGDGAVDEIIEALRNEATRVRKHAAVALGKIGATRAAAALEELVDDEEYEVSKAAQEALLKLKPVAKVWMKDWQKSFR